MKSFFVTCLFVVFISGLSIQSLYATHYYVSPNGDDSDGLSWSNAYTSLQTVLGLVSSGDEIWVLNGEYFASEGTDNTVSFEIPSGVIIYGGFIGTETDIDDRELSDLDGDGNIEDWEFTYPSVLNGEIQNDGDDTNNTKHIVTIAAGVEASTLLNGFTIQNGYSDTYSGGINASGIYALGGTISACIIKDCETYSETNSVYGSGLYAEDATVESILIKDCSATGSVVAGGGAYIGNVNMSGCVITGCSGTPTGTKGYGGGIYATDASHIMNCKFSDCFIGGTYSSGGGGGAYLISSTTCVNTVVYNCQAESNGGGVYLLGSYFVNGVVANNKVTSGSSNGGGAYGDTDSYFYNSVFWGNATSYLYTQINNYPEVQYCAFEETTHGTNSMNVSADNDGSDTDINYVRFNSPTSFVGLSDGTATNESEILLADWSVGLTSALIEEGTSKGLYEASLNIDLDGDDLFVSQADDFYDLAGETRLFNKVPDIGAYEIEFLDWTLPDAPTLEYGSALGDIELSGGSVTDLRTSETVTGVFSFVDAATVPPYSKESLKYQVVFTPEDLTTYAEIYDSLIVNITAKELVLSGLSAVDKIYDGTTAVEFSGTADLDGIVGSDDVILNTGDISAVFEDKNVGTAKNIVFSGFTLSGADAGNYTLSYYGATASITIKSISMVTPSADDKVYDGDATASYTYSSVLTNVISGDDVEIDASGVTALFADENVGTNKTVSFTGFSLSGTDAANYTLTQPSSTTASISALGLTVTGVSASDKEYDGGVSAVINGTAIVSGIIDGDDVSLVTSNVQAVFEDKNVDVDKTVTFDGYVLSGSDATNYILTQPNNATASITLRSLSVAGLNVEDRDYDGTTEATISGTISLSGSVDGDDVTLNTDNISAVFEDANAGVDKNVSISGYVLSGSDKNNYSFDFGTYTATINQVEITVAAIDLSKVYGEDDPELTYSVTGTLVNGDVISGMLVREEGEDVGIYAINQGSLSLSTNYSLKYTVAEFTITQAANVIEFTLDSPVAYESGLTISLDGSATSGLTVSYASSNSEIASVSGTLLQINSYGTVEITATENANGNFIAADPVTVTLVVYPKVEIVQKGDNMLLIDNSDGFFYGVDDAEYITGDAYQWYLDGVVIDGATKQYYYDATGLNGEYYCMVTTRNSDSYESDIIAIAVTQSMNVYPAPVEAGASFHVDLTGFDEGELENVVLGVYSTSGVLIQKIYSISEAQTLSIQKPGVYIIKASGTSSLSKRIIVK